MVWKLLIQIGVVLFPEKFCCGLLQEFSPQLVVSTSLGPKTGAGRNMAESDESFLKSVCENICSWVCLGTVKKVSNFVLTLQILFRKACSHEHLMDVTFLPTIWSFLLTVELFYLLLTILAFLLRVGAFSLTFLVFQRWRGQMDQNGPAPAHKFKGWRFPPKFREVGPSKNTVKQGILDPLPSKLRGSIFTPRIKVGWHISASRSPSTILGCSWPPFSI